jgi:hypothetical protein
MSSVGFTVGWLPTLGSGLPHLPQTLRLDDDPNVAGSASSVERPALGAEIPVGGAHRLELAADSAGLPPFAISELTPGVDALVGESVDEGEVGEGVVLLVAVPVVDLVAVRDGAVDGLPGDDVPELESVGVAGRLASEVALAGDVLPVGPERLRSALAHERSLSHSPRSR